MAKSVKDITSWEGGISNAIEPSDAGDDKNTTEILKNLDGTTKKGVLKPSGSMIDFDTRLSGFDISSTEYGKGFEIMPLDYDLGGTELLRTDGTTVFGTPSTDSTYFTENGTPVNSEFSGSVTGSMRWTPLGASASASLAFSETNSPSLDANTWYSLEMNYICDPQDAFDAASGTQNYLWMRLNDNTVGGFVNFKTHIWSDVGITSSTGDSRVVKIVFKPVADGKNLALDFYGATDAHNDSNYININNIVITKLASSQSNEVQFLQHVYSGTNSKVNVYQNGGDASGTIGTYFRQIDLGDIDAANKPDISYLKSSNAIRISDGNFENTYNTKFFGFIDREFFKDTETLFSGESSLAGDGRIHRGIKRKYWIEEDAKLIAPFADSCTMPCLGDIENYAATGGAFDGDLFWHYDLIEETETDAPNDAPYLLRLEYAVVKSYYENADGASDQPGNWNPAEDGQTPANVTTEEKSVKYHFYCSFVYDRGAQESELTQIRKIPYQGYVWDSSTYNGDAKRHPAAAAENTNGEIELFFHDTLSDTVRSLGANYIIEKAWDCAVKFRATIMPSAVGSGRWGLPERCTGVNWYYSTSQDAHNKKYRLIETDFVDGVKYLSSDTSDWTEWTCFQTNNTTMAKLGLPDNDSNAVRWFYSSSDDGEDGMVTMKDPPQGEDWDSIYGMKSSSWPDIQYKCSTIVGGQAYYGHVKIGSETHRDRVLVSIGNHGYDMIPDDNYLEVIPGDGDEIVELLTYGNQLYVFKKNKVVVCDVGGEEDKVASEHLVGGIQQRSQACVTSKGIFWVNKFGAFLSSGEDAESKILGKINVEHLNADKTSVNITTVAESTTVTNVANAAVVVGAEVYHYAFPGSVTRVASVTSTTEFEAEDAAIKVVTTDAADFRAGFTDCAWSLRDDDLPYIGYNPMEEQVFIVSSSKPDIKKHFWKYDLKEDSFWYHDGDYVTVAEDGTNESSGSPAVISYASNDEVKIGMIIQDANGEIPLGQVVSVESTTSCTLSNDSLGDSTADNTFYFTGGSFRTIDQSTNFGLNKDLKLTALSGDLSVAPTAAGVMTYWDKSPTNQNIWYDTGYLDFGSPSSYKQFYKISVVSKNSNSNVILYMYGIAPDQGTYDQDGPGLFPLTGSGAFNVEPVFRKTDHIFALPHPSVLYPMTSKSLFFKVVIRSGSGPMPEDFELHSVSIIYRDRGVVGPIEED